MFFKGKYIFLYIDLSIECQLFSWGPGQGHKASDSGFVVDQLRSCSNLASQALTDHLLQGRVFEKPGILLPAPSFHLHPE